MEQLNHLPLTVLMSLPVFVLEEYEVASISEDATDLDVVMTEDKIFLRYNPEGDDVNGWLVKRNPKIKTEDILLAEKKEIGGIHQWVINPAEDVLDPSQVFVLYEELWVGVNTPVL